MPRWPWIERRFTFDYPAAKFPDILDLFHDLKGVPGARGYVREASGAEQANRL